MDKKKRITFFLISTILVLFVIWMHNAYILGASQQGFMDKELIERSDYYTIYQKNSSFYCSIYNADNKIVKTDGPFIKQPHVSVLEEKLLRVSWQSGTGMGTQCTYYYDIRNNRFSKIFRSVFDEYGDNIVYCTANKVIVQNIFNEEILYQEIAEFSKPFANMAFPFYNIHFIGEGNKISISYYSGDDYQRITEEMLIYAK